MNIWTDEELEEMRQHQSDRTPNDNWGLAYLVGLIIFIIIIGGHLA